MRKTKTIPRDDFMRLVHELEPETCDALVIELHGWVHGGTCRDVEISVDSIGRIDSMSSPKPVTCPHCGSAALGQVECPSKFHVTFK